MNEIFNFSFNKQPIHTINLIKNKICEKENIVNLDKPNIENSDILDLGDGHRISTSFNRLSIYSFFNSPFNKKMSIKSLSDLLDNNFYKDEAKYHIIRIYAKIKKCYNIFLNIANKFKWNKMKKYDNNYDLCMNNLSDFKKTTLIEIAEDNVRYIFRISDMIKIFNNSLTNNYEMFAEPLHIRNPYTNKEISIHNLYNIYYTIKYSNINMPTLIHLFYLSNFDIDDFILNNEEKIRDMSIISYIKNLTNKKLNKTIREMFKRYRFSFRLKVNENFPMQNLNEIFLPFVKLYIQIKYTLSRVKKTKYTYILKNKLILFCKHAPLFGRKIIKIKEKKKHYYFNSDCKTFNELKINDNEMAYIESENMVGLYDDDNASSDSDSDSVFSNNNNEIINNNPETNNENENNIATFDISNRHYIAHVSNIEWQTETQIFDNRLSNIATDFSSQNFYIDPISLYTYNENEDIEDSDNEEEEEEEEERRQFPYNYDSH
jgi:hypothetical protein